MNFSLAEVVLAAGIAFLTSIVGGVSGYGGGLVMPIVIAPIVGVSGVIPTLAIAMSLGNGSRVLAYWREIDRARAVQVMVTALPLSFVGAYLYTLLPERAIAGILGGFLLVIVPLRRWLAKKEYVLGTPGLMTVSSVYGLISGAMSGAGLMILSALMAAGVTGGALVGTDAASALLINLIKIAIFSQAGLIDVSLLVFGLIIGLATFPGAFVARAIVRRMPLRIHTAMMDAIVIAGGFVFLWQAIR
jgi:uncharacterized membrane protein YfcA